MEKIIVNNPEKIEGLRVVQDGEEIYKALTNGETVMHWESGNSMFPILMHLEYCRISPIEKVFDTINPEGWNYFVGKPVFCRFYYRNDEGNIVPLYMVHRCTEVIQRGEDVYFRIDGTDGTHFGWTKDVFGVAESTNIFQDEKALWNL